MQNCMEKYKNEFSIKFAKLMEQRLDVWKTIQTQERKSLYSLEAFGLYFGVAAFGFIPGKREYNYDLKMHCWIAVAFFICAIIGNIQSTNKNYQNRIKSSLFPELLSVFGEKIYYDKHAGYIANIISKSLKTTDITNNISDFNNYESGTMLSHNIANSVFERCSLYPDKKITHRENDDIFSGEYQDVKFIINETNFGWNANDKHHTYYQMFKGIAMQFKMFKQIKSKVLILTKHSQTKIGPNFEKVILEYEKFNKKYDIYVEKNIMGGGQIEARYLLNTAFMERLMQIQTSFHINKMCCSVFGNEMLIMLSTGKDLFEMNHLLGKIDDIKQYKHLFDEFASVLSFIEVLNLSSKTKL